MKKNISLIKCIPVSKEKEILEFAYKTDNSNLLPILRNKTLVFSGLKDVLMPVERGRELHRLIENSRLVMTDSEHYNTFTAKDLKKLDQFLV